MKRHRCILCAHRTVATLTRYVLILKCRTLNSFITLHAACVLCVCVGMWMCSIWIWKCILCSGNWNKGNLHRNLYNISVKCECMKTQFAIESYPQCHTHILHACVELCSFVLSYEKR